ncbi:hypothetical protein NDU88_004711 [Pleurodeles waltl]|uniref:Uncharacterized protein n=1 Tax=Pleurodeles waltl TaxID=8319 RepID=A0AAV7MW82_PLEWA|nr:hypothetical protein NDU88_004711 [Pleurodeles waltl]
MWQPRELVLVRGTGRHIFALYMQQMAHTVCFRSVLLRSNWGGLLSSTTLTLFLSDLITCVPPMLHFRTRSGSHSPALIWPPKGKRTRTSGVSSPRFCSCSARPPDHVGVPCGIHFVRHWAFLSQPPDHPMPGRPIVALCRPRIGTHRFAGFL